jgi:hypothetical protein
MVREPVGAAPIHISLRRLEEDEISPGWLIIGGMVIFAILYIFFGTLYNSKVLDKEELPHAEFWRSLSGLVQDGVRYAFSCFSDTVSSSRAQAGGYTPVANVGFEVQEEEGERTKKFRKKQSPALVGRRTRLCEAAMVGTTKLVKQRLKSEEGQAELDRGDARGCTPFHHACGARLVSGWPRVCFLSTLRHVHQEEGCCWSHCLLILVRGFRCSWWPRGDRGPVDQSWLQHRADQRP